jgi:hypothetical protein
MPVPRWLGAKINVNPKPDVPASVDGALLRAMAPLIALSGGAVAGSEES